MSAQEADRLPTDATGPAVATSVGATLREAREREGWSIDDVSQQLKLAPRQVRALEDGEFALLPGRTFVRGFVRNYARLLKLDTEAVLAALPAASNDTGLESPTLHPTAPTMGELPATESARPSFLRWAIPLLVIFVAAALAYEFLRPQGTTRVNSAAPAAVERDAAADAKPAAGDVEPAGKAADAAKALPNPVAGAPLPNPVGGTALPNPVASPSPPSPGAGTPLPNPIAEPSLPPATAPRDAAPADARRTAATPAAPAAAAGEHELVLVYRDHSWTEVRERGGRMLLSTMMAPGTRQTLRGTPPFDLVIGNAVDVSLTLDGRKVDLVPHTRQSVARLTLQ